MSALPQPKIPVKTYSQRQQASTNYRQASTANRRPANFTVREIPIKLKILMLLQKGSFGFALVSMASSVALYMATVRIPELWSQEYKNLETLQRQERQLTEINETLKYQMARQAEQKQSKLSSIEPDDAVFVTPAEVKSELPVDSDRNLRKKIAFKYAIPGY